MIAQPWVYYSAAACNLALRVAWVLTISPGALGIGFQTDLFTMLRSALEVCSTAVLLPPAGAAGARARRGGGADRAALHVELLSRGERAPQQHRQVQVAVRAG